MGGPFKRMRFSTSCEPAAKVTSLEERHVVEEKIIQQHTKAGVRSGSRREVRRRPDPAQKLYNPFDSHPRRDAGLKGRDTSTVTTATATVVDVIIQDGTTEIAALTVPNAPTVVSVGSVEITIGASTTTVQIGSSTSSCTPEPTTFSTLSPPSNSSTGTQLATVEVINGTFTSTLFATTLSTSNSSTSLPPFTILSSFTFVEPSPTVSSTSVETVSTSTSGGSSTSSSSSSSSTSTATAPASAGNTSNSSGPLPTPKIVGSVVGSLAGLALILIVLLWLLRRVRKRREAREALPESPGGAGASGPMTQPSGPSSRLPFLAAAVPILGRLRHQDRELPAAAAGAGAGAGAATGERSFQKLGGRKVGGVLAGGDPYGGNYGAFEKETGAGPAESQRDSSILPAAGGALTESSFYRDSQGYHGGRGDQSATASLTALPQGQSTSGARDFSGTGAEEPVSVIRPSPARTPVHATASIPSLRSPTASPVPPHVQGQDGVGRSLSAHDGSRGSRFTEGV